MIAFQLKRSSRDLVGHAVLILFPPLILIFFFDYLYKNISIETGMGMGGAVAYNGIGNWVCLDLPDLRIGY